MHQKCILYGIEMIRILLKQQMDEKSFNEGRRVTFQEVSEQTGISKPTLTRIANVPGYSATTDTIDALCDYFACQPGDILVKVESKK
jgi:putative transcriptional regulator